MFKTISRASLLLTALLGLQAQAATTWYLPYGVAADVPFSLYNADGTLDVDEVDGGSEVSLMCYDGTPASVTATNDFVDRGSDYSISLTATEMQCAFIAVTVAATTTEVFYIQTLNNALASVPVVNSNVTQFGGANGTFAGGRAEVNTSHWGGTAVGSATVNANMSQISADSAAADRLEAMLDGTCGQYPELGVLRGSGCTAQAYTAGTPSITLDTSAAFGDNALTGATIMICSSTLGYCQAGLIASNVGTSDVATLAAALPVTPTGTVTYTIYSTAASSGGGGLDAAGVRAAVGLASANLDTQLGGIQSDTNDIQTRLPAALVSGRMDSSTGAMAAGVVTPAAVATGAIDADALSTDAGTELATANWANGTRTLSAGTNIVLAKGTGITGFNDLDAAGVRGALGMASANLDAQLGALVSQLTTIDDFIDTEIAAVKAKTDQMNFGVSGQLDVNVESMNANPVCGTGDAGNAWTGCP